MIDTNMLDNVLDDILEGAETDTTDTDFLKVLEDSPPVALLDRFLNFQGIVGFTEMIVEAMETIDAANSNSPGKLMETLVCHMWDDEQESYKSANGLTDDSDIISHALANPDQSHIYCTLAKIHSLETTFPF